MSVRRCPSHPPTCRITQPVIGISGSPAEAICGAPAQAVGVRRYLQQSSGFFLEPGPGLADESVRHAIHASPGIAASAGMYASLETRVLCPGDLEGTALRYGFFYGPNTWYYPDGAAAEDVRQQRSPVVGDGQGVWSFVHVDDAAKTTAAAMTAEPGIYNVVDDDPSPVSRWLPAFAVWLGAPPPPRISEDEARTAAGDDAVFYGTRLRGATNQKARKLLGFEPRRLEWFGAGVSSAPAQRP